MTSSTPSETTSMTSTTSETSAKVINYDYTSKDVNVAASLVLESTLVPLEPKLPGKLRSEHLGLGSAVTQTQTR
ncbi:uncharacterized [Tachysurus ichikawai]